MVWLLRLLENLETAKDFVVGGPGNFYPARLQLDGADAGLA
jgi:hypothetical protein